METILALALIGWVAVGTNLLFTYNDGASPTDVRQ
jgi:hypothetical protein